MSEERQYVTNFTFPNGETYYVKDTEAHSKIDAINQNLTGIMTYKGTKATASELPATNNKTGDVWHITENGSEWAWNGTTWEELGNSEASGELVNAVLYDKVQNLTESQKAQARSNIGALVQSVNGKTGPVTVNAVLYDETQTLTDAQKNTACGNIGAIGQLEYDAIQQSLSALDADISLKADEADVPTKVSDLQNDTGYITASQVPAAPVQSVNGKTGSVTVNEVPDATSATVGQVLSKTANGLGWTTPSGGGGGSASLVINLYYHSSTDSYTTSAGAAQLYNALPNCALAAAEHTIPVSAYKKDGTNYVTAIFVDQSFANGDASAIVWALTAATSSSTVTVTREVVSVNGVPDATSATVGQVLTKTQYGPRWADSVPSSGAALRLLYDGAFAPDDPDLMLMGNVANTETGNAIATALYTGRIGSAVLVDVTDSNTEVVYDLFAVDYDAQTHVSTVTFARTESDCIRTATLSGSTKTAPVFGTIPLAGGSAENAVLYTPQSLTDSQKAQARTNVGAGTYSKPSGGIPASDLASDVQTSLGKDARLDSLATFSQGEETVIPLFTNQLPISTDTDGTIFHGVGYHEGYRFNSSGEEVAATGVSTTGFIPATRSSVLRFSDIGMYVEEHTGVSLYYIYVCTYDSSKTFTGSVQLFKMLQNAPDCMIVVDGNATEIDFSKTVDGSYGVRTGTAFVRISAFDVSSDSIITVNEEIAYDEHGEITSATLKSDVSIPQLAPLDARITALEEDEGGGTIDSTDPLVKYAKQIDNGLTVGYEPTLTGRPTADLVAKKYLNFLHISDTHGSVNVENAVKILNKLKADGRCSFLVHTGDFHASTFADVASWNAFAGYIAQATAPVLLVSGNHDVGNNSQSTTNGQTATDAQLYARCFEPYISGWNLTSHPTGKCYWYKDFADEGVRLIGLYDFESDYATDSTTGDLLYKRGYAAYHQAQIDWLVQALLSCPSGYGVIIAKHNPMNKRGTLDNPFNGEFLQGQNTSQSYVSKDMIAEIVQAFMDGTTINKTFAQTGNVTDTLSVNQSFANKNTGAHFICYLDGHTHADGVNFLADFPKQLELNIGCDNYHYQHYSDTYNQQGTLHQDLLNYVSVDVNRGYVYIQRIGNDYTAQADRRDFTAIDYKNPPVVVDFPEVDASDDGKVWGVSGGQYGLIAPPTPTEPVLEEILTIVGDGTRKVVSTDTNGDAFSLKKMVVKAEFTENASAAGNMSLSALSAATGTPMKLCSLYFTWAASATNKFKAEGVLWQENGFWRQTSYGFADNGYGAINGTYAYDFAVSAVDYPTIKAVDTGRIVPVGITIKVYGVRA